jgi:hypothetical protein
VSEADKRQVGGQHYKAGNPAQEHWNLAVDLNWDYLTAQVIKYAMRWKKKNGIQDLEKARHFLDKLIEVEKARQALVVKTVAETPYGSVLPRMRGCPCECHMGGDILHVTPCCSGMIQESQREDGEPTAKYVDQD